MLRLSTRPSLQALTEMNAAAISAMPGMCQTGRMIGCDSIDDLGWERIDDLLDRDSILGFRLIPTERVDDLRGHLTKRNFRFDTWAVLLAAKTSAMADAGQLGLPSARTASYRCDRNT
jgi:hypothetical protein